MALFSRAGNSVEAPTHAACLDIKGGQIAAVRGVAAGDTAHDDVFDQQRCAGNVAAALARIFHVDTPQLRAGLLVERHHVVVGSAKEDPSVPHGDATILSSRIPVPCRG